MVIQIDSREKARVIQKILEYFEHSGVKYFISKLPVGDYISLDNPRLAIDRKHNLAEVVQNVCQDHRRFTSELARANDLGIRLIILVEHGQNVRTLEDVIRWENPRLKVSPLAMSGERLYKVMVTMQRKYGIEWQFCEKRNTGARIRQILEGEVCKS